MLEWIAMLMHQILILIVANLLKNINACWVSTIVYMKVWNGYIFGCENNLVLNWSNKHSTAQKGVGFSRIKIACFCHTAIMMYPFWYILQPYLTLFNDTLLLDLLYLSNWGYFRLPISWNFEVLNCQLLSLLLSCLNSMPPFAGGFAALKMVEVKI